MLEVVTSVCDSFGYHHYEAISYFYRTQYDIWDASVFGWVYRLQGFQGAVYAVKEIKLTIPPAVVEFIQNLSELSQEAVRLKMESLSYDENFDIKSLDELSRSTLWPKEQKEQEALKQALQLVVFNIQIAHKNLLNEVEISKKVSKIQPRNNQYTLHFCVRYDSLTYLLFQDLYGPTLDKPVAVWSFSQLSIYERFAVYVNLIEKVLVLHQNGIVHCDIRHHNIAVQSNVQNYRVAFTDLAVLNYGFAMQGKKCTHGMPSYVAPEILLKEVPEDNKDPYKYTENAYKADVYSLGMLIADMELKIYGMRYDILAEHAAVYQAGKLDSSSTYMKEKIREFFENISKETFTQILSVDNRRVKFFYMMFKRAIYLMTASDVEKRETLDIAYKQFVSMQKWTEKFKVSNGDFDKELQFIRENNSNNLLGSTVFADDLKLRDVRILV